MKKHYGRLTDEIVAYLNSKIFGGCNQIIHFLVTAYENTNVVGRRDQQVFS